MELGVILPGVGNEVLLTFFFCIIITIIVGIVTFKKIFNMSHSSERTLSTEASHHSYNNEVCPICISPHVLAVETNCGHKFCGSCLRSYLNNRMPGDFTIFDGRLSCPLCRQDINLLLLCFTQEELQSNDLEEAKVSVESVVHDYNVRFGVGPRSYWSYVRDCPVLIRHMLLDFFSFRGLVWMFRVRVIICFLAALVYLGNPIDFVPEAVFGIFGFLDDLIVFFLCAVYVSVIYRRFVISRGYSQ